jgi:hypothetical protein
MAVGVDGQAGVVGHRVGRYRRDLHAGREAHLHDVSAGEASADGVTSVVADRVGTAAEDCTAVTAEER